MTIRYELRRSDRKTLSLEITEDLCILVRAPRRLSARVIDDFVLRHEDWIEQKYRLQEERRETHKEPTADEEAALRRSAKAVLPERVRVFGRLMGLSPSGVKITSARKRFGSCSASGSICFSWRLMMYPPACIDYVVVHELSHLRHRNHGRAFYDLIASVLPDYKTRRELLKQFHTVRRT